MTTLKEQMQDRMAERPDKQTLAWWDSRFDECVDGYRGATHAMNRTHAEVEDQNGTIKELKVQVKYYAEEFHEAKVEIGKLQAEVTELQESMEKSRQVYSELKKQILPSPRGE